MTAAERLKALKELQDRNPHVHILNDSLKIAYPQILAVVEQVRCKRDPWGYSRCSSTATREQMCDACAALRALEEALS
jgi:hypothetical protein